MFFFKILLVLFLSFLSVDANAANEKKKRSFCQQAKDFKSDLYVYVDQKRTDFDFKKPVSDLTNNSKEVMDEWQDKQEDAVWASADLITKGLTRTGVGVETSVKLIAKPYDKYGVYYCPYIERLEIRFYIKNTVFVASEFKKDSCDFKNILEHEMKHHDTNLEVVRDVVAKFKKDLPKMVSYLERRYIKKEEVSKKFGAMNQSVRDAFEVYSDVLVKEMNKRNDLIDTTEEYERVAKACQ